MAERIGTYRWQLTPERGFDSAAVAVPDLAALGVSHLYLSPVAEAVPGSTHGYDVTDPTRLRDELGGRDAFARLAAACAGADLHLLVDIVPNHLAAHERNPWWWDALRLGPTSRFAEVFDVDWTSTDPLLLPVLADQYGRELEAGRLRLERGPGEGRLVVVRRDDRTFPLRPETEGAILAMIARSLDDDVLGVAARVLARGEGATPDLNERDADLAVAERTVRNQLGDPRASAAVDQALTDINADPDRLDLVLARQHYRLARWTVGDAELGYRRFFDIDALAATRMDGPLTFDLLHRLPAELVGLAAVDGLRVDHIDGLADPAGYLRTLRDVVGASTWLVVEKIARRGEAMPSWPVAGTTGYEVADLLGGWLTDPAGGEALRAGWALRTGERRTYREVSLEARREVLAAGFAADVDRVVEAVHAVCQERRRHRDHARAELRGAIVELAVHMPRYRTYVVPACSAGEQAEVADTDREVIEATVAAARAAAPELDPELLELLAAVLAGRYTGDGEAQVVTRFQQLTGPIAAKGEEDTAIYRWLPLPHRCEVGADPSLPPTTVDAWHRACELAHARWPEGLTTLSTHDTKRSADARARLAALTTASAATLAAFDQWWGAVAPTGVAADVIDVGTGWMVFHALLAAWPIDLGRAWTVIEKSAREAGLRTSWTAPDEAFEATLRQLVAAALDGAVARTIVMELLTGTADAADVGAMAQLLAQLLAPGVPDLYQGAEGWDRSLVDPDNRRAPDPGRRRQLVTAAATVDPAHAWADPGLRRSGLPRTVVLRTALGARRRHSAAVGSGPSGAYTPVMAAGRDAERVLSFARGGDPRLLAVVVRPASHAGVQATVTLPAGEWVDLFTGHRHEGPVDVARLLDLFPVALLER